MTSSRFLEWADPAECRIPFPHHKVNRRGRVPVLEKIGRCLASYAGLTDPSGHSWLSSAFKKLRRHVHAAVRFLHVPTAKNLFEMIKSTPGQDKIDNYVMTHQWAYMTGQLVATVATSWGGGFGGALWSSYYTYRGTGSVTEALKVGAITYATSYASQGGAITTATHGMSDACRGRIDLGNLDRTQRRRFRRGIPHGRRHEHADLCRL
jgi:hypothetical protein